MGSSRKRKKTTTPLREDRQNGEEKEKITPKRRGIAIEDPQEGCSQQVSKAQPATQLPKNTSFLHGLQNQWRRFAGFIKKKKTYILKKGRQLWGIDDPNKTTTKHQSSVKGSKNKIESRKRETEDHGAPTKRPKLESATTTKSKEPNVAFEVGETTEKRLSGRKRPFTDRRSKINMNELEPRKKAKLDSDYSHKESTEEGEKATAPLTVDKFTFHHVLGEGGFGKVMLATDSIRKESVAIKAVKKRSALRWSSGLEEGEFLQIAQESIFLVHGYGAFHTQNYIYFVMELVTAGTLYDLIEERQWLSLCTVRFLVAEMVCGIQFLHSKGIVHRDLKADNILLTTKGHIKITDFGLAIRVTREGDIHGTPAPEKITGEPYYAAEDWFSLGVITNGLVTGCRPAETVAQVTDMVQKQETSENFDHAAKDLLTGLLCKDKSLRLGMRGNIREHTFFSSINWDELESGKTESPLKISEDTMEEYVTRQISVPHSEAEKKQPIINQELFEKVSFVCPAWSAHYHTAPMHPDP
ncbi:cAMP-dependent protein kinase type 1-like [Bufo bufo]|uniref:cAMP-dependent protein kinase type 1-like n=1 Tax=Bufo bufo TaxID=8384 RepID=UPI001ABE3678|nr:cAMP-dependent protein kinase type 1-like [Bufo bufo]